MPMRICGLCEKKFWSNTHVCRKKPTKPPPCHRCQACKQVFSSKARLISHVGVGCKNGRATKETVDYMNNATKTYAEAKSNALKREEIAIPCD